MQLFSKDLDREEWVPSLPEGYSGRVLPGSEPFYCSAASGTATVQQYNGEGFTISYLSLDVHKKLSVTEVGEQEGFYIRITMKNAVSESVKGHGRMEVREGQFAGRMTSRLESRYSLEGGKQYQQLCLFYDPAVLASVSEAFTCGEEVLSRAASPKWLSPPMHQVIRDLLHCPYAASTRKLFFEIKIKELLLEMLVRSEKRTPITQPLGIKEKEAAIRVREFILSDISRHFTIRQLARRVHLNEFTLKQAFKKQHGKAIFECLQEARMEMARELLLHTDQPLKAIINNAGYKRITSFITAFRKHFGYTPGSLRRRLS